MERGRAALARADWPEARRAFETAVAAATTAEAFEGLGMAAWWLDDAPAVFAARERAYRLFREGGDRRGAARVAMMLAQDYRQFRGEVAVARGWHARAGRLLDGLAPTPERGWLCVWEGDLVLAAEGDAAQARALAAEAAERGRTLNDVDLQMTALALEGLALVTEGALPDGMRRLDETAAAAVGGDMRDPLAIGVSWCYLVIACERIGDLERAAAWCARMQALAARVRFNALLGVCHAQYAGVLMSRGAWREAELELEAAIQRLAASRPAMQQDAHVRLAELRRRQGRFAEAHALLVPLDGHPNAELVRAALALDRRDPRAALQIAERFLRRMPPSNRTDRVRALDLLHRACLALGQRLDAARAEEELHRIAIGIGTAPLRACALAAEARARAADDREAARRAFEDAVDLYRRCGARYEHACVQRELGELLLALGERDSGHVELRAARDAFHEMGAVWHGEQVAALLHGAGLAGTASSARGAGGLTRREIQVLRLVAEGSSNRRIARTLAVSDFTIKRHVANILLKLDLPSRAAAAAYAAKAGLA